LLERQSRRAGESLASWSTRVGIESQAMELSRTSPAFELEGLATTDPFLDRRLVVAAVCAQAHERGAAPSRHVLGAILDKTAGRRPPGAIGYATRSLHAMLRAGLEGGNDLFRAPTLVELGVVNRERLELFLTRFEEGSMLSRPLWRLISMEAWARHWLAGEGGHLDTTVGSRDNG
jgi:hypothetical protein